MKIEEIQRVLREYGMETKLFGDPAREIKGFSDPRDYRADTAIWIGKLEDIFFPEDKKDVDIALVIARPGIGAEKILPNVLITSDPKSAFMRLVFRKYAVRLPEYQDPMACVSPTAEIGKNCYIARNVVIEDGAKIGDNCEIRENTYIGKGCIIGAQCVIGQNCVIGGETNGSSFEDSDGIMKNMPNIGIVRIGRNVQIGAGSIIAKATFTETVIGDECELNAGTFLGHNARIGNRVRLLGRNTISGNSSIGDNSKLVSCCVKNRVVIGKNVKGGIGSVILQDVPDGKTCIGNPANIMPDEG